MYSRIIKSKIEYWLKEHMVLIVYGARQVGKTTLVKEIAAQFDPNYKYFDCENFEIQEILNSRILSRLENFVGDAKLIVFDEAQKVQHIGVALKLIHDHIPTVKIIATGSSSFELANKISEPLTGRNIKFELYPLSMKELGTKKDYVDMLSQFRRTLQYGSYPAIVDSDNDKSNEKLKNLANDYLYQDIINIGHLRNPLLLRKVVKSLAILIGQTITATSIANLAGTDRATVERYIDLLEKSFIIKVLRPLHRSHSREIMFPFKVYFYDLGIRNAILGEFKPIEQRDDTEVGALWENFCVIERIKKNEYGNPEVEGENYGINKLYYFWRTKEPVPKEYDLIEERNGFMDVFEMKWNARKAQGVKNYAVFFETYPNSKLYIIHNDNWMTWLM
jgi:uncharacterized protein